MFRKFCGKVPERLQNGKRRGCRRGPLPLPRLQAKSPSIPPLLRPPWCLLPSWSCDQERCENQKWVVSWGSLGSRTPAQLFPLPSSTSVHLDNPSAREVNSRSRSLPQWGVELGEWRLPEALQVSTRSRLDLGTLPLSKSKSLSFLR